MTKISQSYAAELARQVGELEAENERLRAEIERLKGFWAVWKKHKATSRGWMENDETIP